MNLPRRHFLQLAGAAAAIPALPRRASALDYPIRPVRIVVGFLAGGPTDIAARLIGQWLSERLGQQFIIENRPGATGNIAAEAVVNAPPDGYTLLQVATNNAINATLYDKLSFNLIRDIAPVASVMRLPNIMEVTPSFPAQTVPEFIAYARANPGKINFASGGNGTSQHVSGELFAMMANIKMIHVPYRGSGAALSDLIGGHLDVMFDAAASSMGYIRSGNLRPLGVTTAARMETLPDVPAISEFLPGYEATGWQGIGAPRNTPTEIIEKLNQAINAGLADPAFKSRIADLGGAAAAASPAEFGKFIADETDKWGKVVRFSGAKAD